MKLFYLISVQVVKLYFVHICNDSRFFFLRLYDIFNLFQHVQNVKRFIPYVHIHLLTRSCYTSGVSYDILTMLKKLRNKILPISICLFRKN